MMSTARRYADCSSWAMMVAVMMRAGKSLANQFARSRGELWAANAMRPPPGLMGASRACGLLVGLRDARPLSIAAASIASVQPWSPV